MLRIQVYPDPASNVIRITCSEKINGLEIYNALGKNIYTTANVKEQTRFETDLSQFSKGIYLIKIYYWNSMYTEKIVLQ